MELPVATQDSSCTHGGYPISYSSDVFAGGKLVLRLGDSFHCNTHGTVTITGSSSTVNPNTKKMAREGDSLSCGATLTNGINSILIG